MCMIVRQTAHPTAPIILSKNATKRMPHTTIQSAQKDDTVPAAPKNKYGITAKQHPDTMTASTNTQIVLIIN